MRRETFDEPPEDESQNKMVGVGLLMSMSLTRFTLSQNAKIDE
jgi:hypothetical protein